MFSIRTGRTMRGRVDNVDWSLSDRKMKGSLCSASAFFMICEACCQ